MSLLEYMPEYVEELARKVENRIAGFARSCNGEIVVYWSGGKDSTLVLLAASRALGYKPPAALANVPGQSRLDFVKRLAEAIGYELRLCKGRCKPESGVVLIVQSGLEAGL